MHCPKCGAGLSPTKYCLRFEFDCESFIWKADAQFHQSEKCKLAHAQKRIKEMKAIWDAINEMKLQECGYGGE